MQKLFNRSVIAGSVLAAACVGAAAESSVNVSGMVRLAVTHGNGGGTPLYGAGGGDGWSVNDHISHLNFFGKEDLGGGLFAGFNLQHFLQADTGMPTNFSPNTFWDGRSIVRLGGGWGELYLGRDYAPMFWTGLGVDPWGWDGSAAQVGIVQWANYLTTSGIRTNNTVGYKTLAVSGLTAQIAVSEGEGAVTGRDVGANVVYAAGPLWLSAAADQHKNSNGVNDDRLLMLAAAYDFGAIRPTLLYASSKVAGVSYSSVGFSATAPVGPGTIKAAVTRLSDWTTGTAAKDALTKASLGYQYDLSKRSNIFGAVASAKGEGVTRTTAVELGISHSF